MKSEESEKLQSLSSPEPSSVSNGRSNFLPFFFLLKAPVIMLLCCGGISFSRPSLNTTVCPQVHTGNISTCLWEIRKNLIQGQLSYQFGSVAQSCPTLCNPMDCSTTGFPVHHQFPKLAQTHVKKVSDAIQSSHPLSSPYPLEFNLSHHQGLFQ